MLYHPTEPPMTDEVAQARIRETIRRHGGFILGSYVQPEIGDIQMWAGLPMKCVRYVSREEAKMNQDEDLWGPNPWDDGGCEFYFEVEVAD